MSPNNSIHQKHVRGLFLRRMAVIPFETATGVLAIWTGSASFVGFGVSNLAFEATLPGKLVALFNLIYVVSGAFMVTGIGWGHRNVEAAGILLLFTSLTIRLLAVQVRLGFTPLTATLLVQGLAFGFACIARLIFLLRNEVIVRAGDLPEIVAAVESVAAEKS